MERRLFERQPLHAEEGDVALAPGRFWHLLAAQRPHKEAEDGTRQRQGQFVEETAHHRPRGDRGAQGGHTGLAPKLTSTSRCCFRRRCFSRCAFRRSSSQRSCISHRGCISRRCSSPGRLRHWSAGGDRSARSLRDCRLFPQFGPVARRSRRSAAPGLGIQLALQTVGHYDGAV